MIFDEEVYRDQLYTEEQSRWLILLPRISAPLSILGSITILYIILQDWKRKLRRVYHRLLLVYSAIDVLCSINFALSALVVPVGTPGVWGANGTITTCEVSGFVTQFSFALGVYATFICMYYALVLRYHVREETLARRFEPFVHALALVTPMVLGVIMLLEDNYNPTNAIVGWCFINVYPMDCLRRNDIACERGEGYFKWLLVNNVPFFLFFIIVATSCVLTYNTVYQVEERGSQWALVRSRQSVLRVQESRTQAYLYIAAFAVTYVFFGIGTLLGPSPPTGEHRNFYLPIVVLIKIFLPLQGFWNCFIYIRPRYVAIRRRHPQMLVRHVLWSVLHSTDEKRSNPHRLASISLLVSATNLWRSRQQPVKNSIPALEGPLEANENIYGPSISTDDGGQFAIVEREDRKTNVEYDEFIPEFNGDPTSIIQRGENHNMAQEEIESRSPGGDDNAVDNNLPTSDREENTDPEFVPSS